MATVLLIDAEKDFADPVAQAIRAMGYDCVWVADGKDGLDKASATHPDAIILCVELPKMSGYSICNKLKKDDALKNIPLIITSREATHETFEQHKKLKTRAEAYLIKPFSPEDLQPILQEYVKGGGAVAAVPNLGTDLKPLDLMEAGGEEDIMLDDLPAGASEEALDLGALAGGKEPDPLDALDGLTIAGEDEEEDRAPTRIMKMPTAADLAAFKPSAAPAPRPAAVPVKPAPVVAARPAATQAAAPAAARPAVAAKPIGTDERSQMEAKLAEARTKASAAAQEVDKLRAEVNQLRTKSREETAGLRKQVQELTEKLKGEQTDLKQRYEEASQKALSEAAQLRQQIKDTQARAQTEMEQLRSQLIEMRNQSQDLLTQRDGEASSASAKVQELSAQLDTLRSENSRAQKVRERTQKAVDVALQLLQETEAASGEDATS